MLSLECKLSSTQFNTLLALYFEAWEPMGPIFGKQQFCIDTKFDDHRFLATERALTRHGLVERMPQRFLHFVVRGTTRPTPRKEKKHDE